MVLNLLFRKDFVLMYNQWLNDLTQQIRPRILLEIKKSQKSLVCFLNVPPNQCLLCLPALLNLICLSVGGNFLRALIRSSAASINCDGSWPPTLRKRWTKEEQCKNNEKHVNNLLRFVLIFLEFSLKLVWICLNDFSVSRYKIEKL